jgi:hypothetical protein
MILSHGEKFIDVNNNPFAQDALKESVSISKIEKNNQKLESIVAALKKFIVLTKERTGQVLTNFDEIVKRENCMNINFGQLTALSVTPVGQAIGMNGIINGGV